MVTWVPSSSTSISANSSANTTITTVTIFEYRLQLRSIISNSHVYYLKMLRRQNLQAQGLHVLQVNGLNYATISSFDHPNSESHSASSTPRPPRPRHRPPGTPRRPPRSPSTSATATTS